jgi:hypothetical protein
MAMVAVKHAYEIDHEVRVYLIDMASKARLAGATAMVEMAAAAPAPAPAGPPTPDQSADPINGIWNASLTCTASSYEDEVGETVAGPMRISASGDTISMAADDGQGGWMNYGTGSNLTRDGAHYTFTIIDASHDSGGLIAMHHRYRLVMETPQRMTGSMEEEIRQNRDGGSVLISEATYEVSFTR